MRYHKTRWSKRTTYTYHPLKGPGVTIRPGEEGVTEAWVKDCHASDDAEVYNNLKNARPEPTAEEKSQRREWEEAHPGEKADQNWNISIDSFTSSDDGEPTADHHAELADPRAYIPDEDTPEDVERMREVVARLPRRQQHIYRMVWLEGYTNVDAAKELGISEATVRKDRKKIIAAIARDQILQEMCTSDMN